MSKASANSGTDREVAGSHKLGDLVMLVTAHLVWDSRNRLVDPPQFNKQSPTRSKGLEIKLGRIVEVGIENGHGNPCCFRCLMQDKTLPVFAPFKGSRTTTAARKGQTARTEELLMIIPPASEVPIEVGRFVKRRKLLVVRRPSYSNFLALRLHCGICLGEIIAQHFSEETGDFRYEATPRREAGWVEGKLEMVDGHGGLICDRCSRELDAPDDVETYS